MGNRRTKLRGANELSLATQANNECPRCGCPLFYEKGDQFNKGYEIAHIYPLNPTPEEAVLLAGEEILSADSNHVDNLIPLCLNCHGKFDKPRTVEDYRELVALKKKFIRRLKQQGIRAAFAIQAELQHIVDALYATDPLAASSDDLQYDIKSLDAKLGDDVPRPTQNKIKHNVSDYYVMLRSRFAELEKQSPNASEIISLQVRAFYLQQKSLGLAKHEVFSNVVAWIDKKTNTSTIEAAEIVASYFVQNCEVFE